jgi:TetR/AcrR family transcriptional regulator, transcriptional repressor for nem operon
MPYVPKHRQATRERILASARRLFNRNGLSEVSIDAVMAGASLTRGAFYHYFDSKEELYAEAITLFARRFPAEPWQCPDLGPPPEGAALARMIVNAYLSRAHLDDIEGSCPLIGLPTDVSRGGSTVKAAFAEVLDMMVSAFAAQIGPDERTAHEKALGIAALCVGGMVLARAVDDPARADDLREAARKLALTIGAWGEPPAASVSQNDR